MHRSIDPSIHASIHPSIRPSMHPCIHASIHPSIHPACIKAYAIASEVLCRSISDTCQAAAQLPAAGHNGHRYSRVEVSAGDVASVVKGIYEVQ